MLRHLPWILLLGAVLPGCRPAPRSVIGVVPKGASHLFWLTVRAGAEKAAGETGYTIEWNAPALETDASRQVEIVESMINRRLAGIALAPVDRKGLAATVDKAAAAGIPTVVYDSDVDTPRRLTYIATNNREGGRLAARRLATALHAEGKIAVIGFMPGSASTMEREEGFREEIETHFPNMRIVALQYGMASRAKAMSQTENILTAHPDLRGLFADNESSSAGALQALKSRRARQVKFVAFDANEQFIADMRAGWIDAIVLQDPFRMGYDAVRAIAAQRSGQAAPPAESSLPAILVTAGNLDQVPRQILPEFQRQFLDPTRP